jgi:hypothetical protein
VTHTKTENRVSEDYPERSVRMKKPCCHCMPEILPEHEHLRPLIEAGFVAKLPNDGPDWKLPEMIVVEGELPSQALIRMRRANHI